MVSLQILEGELGEMAPYPLVRRLCPTRIPLV